MHTQPSPFAPQRRPQYPWTSYQPKVSSAYLLAPGPGRYRFGAGAYALPPASLAPPDDLDQPQTVDQIVARGFFAAPADDPVTALLTDRRTTTQLGLNDLIDQLQQRIDIYRQNLSDIEDSKLAATNDFHGRKNALGVDYDRELAALNETLIGLYQQQREERVTFWRDLSRLRQVFPETAQMYLSALRKSSLVNDLGGDAP